MYVYIYIYVPTVRLRDHSFVDLVCESSVVCDGTRGRTVRTMQILTDSPEGKTGFGEFPASRDSFHISCTGLPSFQRPTFHSFAESSHCVFETCA